MTRSYTPSLFLLSAIWGSSYLFIKVGVRDLSPPLLVELRLVLAALVLVGFLCVRGGVRAATAELWAARREGVALGIVNVALPFTLIAWGELHIASGVAAIANASVPIFVALLAPLLVPNERASGLRLAGVFVGLAGVAVLAGVDPRGGWPAVAGTLAVVAASLAYGWSNLFAQRRMAAGGPAMAAASMVVGLVVLLPFALAQLPAHAPGWQPLGSVVALGVLGTGVAQLVLYRMLRLHGSSRTTLVSYLIPGFAVAYGIGFLGEPLTAPELAGLALILAGVALGAGVLRPPGRAAATQAP